MDLQRKAMEYRLSELFDLQMGKTPSRNIPEYWNSEDHKWISIGDLSKCGKYIHETKEYLSDRAVEESGISQIPANTVIMSFKLSIGKTAITLEPMYSNEAIMSFRDKGIIDILPDYFYYMFLAKNWSEGTNKAVMGATLNKTTLSQVKVYVHGYSEQKKIVEILDRVNSVISNYKQELQKLDELIKARFVEMFGDPINNEKMWKINTFGDICTVHQGLQIPISKRLREPEDDCYEYITVQYLHGGKEKEYIKSPKESVKCTEKDILMTRTGNTGMVITGVKGVFHNNFFLIDFDRKKYNKEFLVQYLNLDLIQAEILRKAGTSTISDLNHGDFYKIHVYEPPIVLQNQFSAFINGVNKSKLTVQAALNKTQLLFDSLMQKYFG